MDIICWLIFILLTSKFFLALSFDLCSIHECIQFSIATRPTITLFCHYNFVFGFNYILLQCTCPNLLVKWPLALTKRSFAFSKVINLKKNLPGKFHCIFQLDFLITL